MITRIQVAMIVALLIALALVVSAKKARTHEWYDHDCCNIRDCRPVLDSDVSENAKGVWKYLPTGATFANEPTFKRIRPSKDNRYHVCVSLNGAIGYCIYIVTGA
jgi:hypothetical protein